MTNPLNEVVYRAGSRAAERDAHGGRRRCVKTRAVLLVAFTCRWFSRHRAVFLKAFQPLESNDRIQNTQPPSYEIRRQRTPTHSFSLSLCSAENISCPHAAGLNCSHWIPVSATPSGQQINIELCFPPQAVELLNYTGQQHKPVCLMLPRLPPRWGPNKCTEPCTLGFAAVENRTAL